MVVLRKFWKHASHKWQMSRPEGTVKSRYPRISRLGDHVTVNTGALGSLIRAEEEEFDPYENRDKEHATNYMEGFANMIKGAIGTGIILMPEAFKNSGWINGFASCVVIAILCGLGLHVYFNCQYIMCKRLKVGVIKYPQLMKNSLESGPRCCSKLAKMSPNMVNFFLVFHQLGICCVYVLFVAENLKNVVDVYSVEIAIEFYILALLIPFILINSIPHMKTMAIFSIIALMLTLASFSIIFYYAFQDLPPLSERQCVGPIMAYPLFVGTFLFSLESVGVIIAIENEMRNPAIFVSKFGVLNMSWIVITAIYAILGFIGYWKYGDEIKQAIILNLPQKEILADVCKIMYAVCVFITYAIQCYVPVRIIWEEYVYKCLEGKKHIFWWQYLMRICIVLFTVIVAASIPLLGLLTSLIGIVALTTLGFLFPAMIDICIRHPDYGVGKIHLWKDILLIFFAFVGFFLGNYVIIREIIIKMIELRS